ncbi:hypothetical protein scyTo_0022112, partial [Scyliorhinus torazame]|nr:hypothetical protein [Scyliorhinus torazame]
YLSVYEIDMKYEETFLLLFCCSQVNCLFLQKSLASSYLSRIRRANDGLEEVLADNLERECNEETCSVEERQEVLRNNPETAAKYHRRVFSVKPTLPRRAKTNLPMVAPPNPT